jgi:hypothetical protein
VHEVARAGEEHAAFEIGVPANVVDMQMGQEDEVHLVARHAEPAECLRQLALVLGGPVPEARRPDAGVDEHGDIAGADEVRATGQPPALSREELRVQRPVRRPGLGRHLRIRVAVLGEQPDRVGNRQQLDLAD